MTERLNPPSWFAVGLILALVLPPVSARAQAVCPPTGSFTDDFEPGAMPGWTVQTEVNLNPASPPWTVRPDPAAHSAMNSFVGDTKGLNLKDDRLIAPPQDLSGTSQLIFWHRFLFEPPDADGGVLEVSTDGGTTWEDVVVGGGSFVEGGYNGTVNAGFGSPIAGRAAWIFDSPDLTAMTRVVANVGGFAGSDVLVRWRLVLDPLFPGSSPGVAWWVDDVQFTNLTVNCPPDAVDDMATTQKDTPVVIPVLANDTDPNGDPLTVTGVSDPPNGSAATNGITATYTPNSGFVGTDTFTYTISDGEGGTDTAQVTATVMETNRAPVAVDDSATTRASVPVTINVLANDSDPDGDPLTVTAVTDPPNGTAVRNADNTVTYDPDCGFGGFDTFSYTISDGKGGTDTGVVTVRVRKTSRRGSVC